MRKLGIILVLAAVAVQCIRSNAPKVPAGKDVNMLTTEGTEELEEKQGRLQGLDETATTEEVEDSEEKGLVSEGDNMEGISQVLAVIINVFVRPLAPMLLVTVALYFRHGLSMDKLFGVAIASVMALLFPLVYQGLNVAVSACNLVQPSFPDGSVYSSHLLGQLDLMTLPFIEFAILIILGGEDAHDSLPLLVLYQSMWFVADLIPRSVRIALSAVCLIGYLGLMVAAYFGLDDSLVHFLRNGMNAGESVMLLLRTIFPHKLLPRRARPFISLLLVYTVRVVTLAMYTWNVIFNYRSEKSITDGNYGTWEFMAGDDVIVTPSEEASASPSEEAPAPPSEEASAPPSIKASHGAMKSDEQADLETDDHQDSDMFAPHATNAEEVKMEAEVLDTVPMETKLSASPEPADVASVVSLSFLATFVLYLC